MILQLLLAIVIIAGTHELGHMLAARAFGIRVEQFSVGFPPVLFRIKVGKTVYTLGLVPLGGFVKLSGMLDESLDAAKLKETPKDYEFRSKPAWQRLIVMLGGIIVNIVTGLFIFIMFAYNNGDQYISSQELNKHGIQAHELGQSVGLQTGDRITALNGKSYERFSDLTAADVLLGDSSYYTVRRDSQELSVVLPSNFVENFSTPSQTQRFISPRMLYRIQKVLPNTPAAAVGLQAGDRLVQINADSIVYFDQLKAVLKKYAGQSVTLHYTRDQQPRQVPLNLFAQDTLGILQSPQIETSKREYSFIESIVQGVRRVTTLITLNVKGISKIVRGEVSASKSLSGPIGIAQMFGGQWQWGRFWTLVGLISIFVALFNLLPIPALDGGHVVFCLAEMITGRVPSLAFMRIAQMVGMALIGLLTLFILFNDIRKFF